MKHVQFVIRLCVNLRPSKNRFILKERICHFVGILVVLRQCSPLAVWCTHFRALHVCDTVIPHLSKLTFYRSAYHKPEIKVLGFLFIISFRIGLLLQALQDFFLQNNCMKSKLILRFRVCQTYVYSILLKVSKIMLINLLNRP